MKNSRVWDHFEIISDTRCVCIHCKKVISKNGGTSNLLKHLTRKHQELHVELELQTAIKFENHPIFENDDKVKNFICLVQMNSVLYVKPNDKDLSEYDKQSIETIWEEIATEFQISEEECRKIWFILRKQYEYYYRTKNPLKCKFINELSFLEEYLQKYQIEKIPMRDSFALKRNFNIQDERNKTLLSGPDGYEATEGVVYTKTEYIDENSTQDYEILYEAYDPILVKNQKNEETFDAFNSNENSDTCFPEHNELYGFHKNSKEEIHSNSKRQQQQNYWKKSKSRYNSSINKRRRTSDNDCSSPKGNRKSLESMDEIDFFFEFLQRKLRKMTPEVSRQLQLKFMETIQEAEVRSRNRIDRGVDTRDIS